MATTELTQGLLPKGKSLVPTNRQRQYSTPIPTASREQLTSLEHGANASPSSPLPRLIARRPLGLRGSNQPQADSLGGPIRDFSLSIIVKKSHAVCKNARLPLRPDAAKAASSTRIFTWGWEQVNVTDSWKAGSGATTPTWRHSERRDSRARDLSAAEKINAACRKTCASCSVGCPRICSSD